MIKFVTLLTLVAVVWTLVSYRKVESKLVSGSVETTTSTSASLTIIPDTLGLSTFSDDPVDGKVYTDEKQNFRLKYFEGVQIKKLTDGTVVFSKDSLHVQISQHPLSAKDTVHTVAEIDIDNKAQKMGDKFSLQESISPIAIGSETGITFTTLEGGKEITYFYIPQGFNYLKIANKTEEVVGQNLISLSDDLIYSLELIER